MSNEDLLSALEERIDTLLSIIEEKDLKVRDMTSVIGKNGNVISRLENRVQSLSKVKNDYDNIKKFLAFSIKDNYILSMKNKHTQNKISSLIYKLDNVLKKD